MRKKTYIFVFLIVLDDLNGLTPGGRDGDRNNFVFECPCLVGCCCPLVTFNGMGILSLMVNQSINHYNVTTI